MPPKCVRRALADTLEDLSELDFGKFCYLLVDRRDEPRVRRCKVEGRDLFDIVDIMVSTFTERGALQVALEILSGIECHQAAQTLVKETS